MRAARLLRSAVLLVLAFSMVLPGCSTVRTLRGKGPQGQQLDPFENWNRKVFSFNEGLDEHVLKPVATVYSELTPRPLRTGIDNFFSNVGDAWSSLNMVLQGRLTGAGQQGLRFVVNTTLGFFGILDIATELGLERQTEDLGKTFGRWGFGTGAYIVWPLFGPSSVRDSLALPWDRLASPAIAFNDGQDKVGIYVLQTINARANFLRAGNMLDGIVLDKYTFIRDAYLTRRGSISHADDDEFEVLTPDSAASAPAAPASAASAQ